MGWKIRESLPTATSTNDLAIAYAKKTAGFEEGSVFIANQQTAGRGRSGRSWESPAGTNLYLSVLLKPACPPARAALITLVAGAAAYQAIAAYVENSKPFKIKWPNDLYLDGRKVGGILTETESEKGSIRWVICGIGINVNASPSDFSPEIRPIATSLKSALEKDIDREALLQKILETFESQYLQFLQEGPEEAIAICNEHSYLLGRRVKVEGVSGIAEGINANGALEIRKDDGSLVGVLSGEVQCF